MHIVYVITRADAVGGATIHVRDLARGLRARGYRTTVLVGGSGRVTEEFDRCGIDYRSLMWLGRSIHPVKDALAVAEIAGQLRSLQPDLVSTHTAKAGLVGRIAAAMAGVPALFTPHGWAIGDRISRRAGALFSAVERLAAPLAARIITVSESERELGLRHGVGDASRTTVIRNGVLDIEPGLRAQPEREPPRLVMVARMEAPKDHATLLDAMARLRDRAWTLELIGEGPLEAGLRRRAAELGIGNRVEFRGASNSVAQRLSDAQAFVLTSRSEGFPRSVLEAMRAGLPVVASQVGGVGEAVAHGVTGMVVGKQEAAPLADAIATLLASPELRARMGRAARRRWEAHFSFERMLEETLQVYHEVLAAPVEVMETAGGSKWQRP